MKKLLSVFLAALMLFSLCSVAASAAEGDELVITVVNDTHYNSIDTARKSNSVSEDFAHVNSVGRLYFEADAIFAAFLDEAAKNESDYVLIVGDITETGTVEQVTELTAMLTAFEISTGKKVFVVPGNHDVLKRSKADFMKDYAQFGYSEALEVDTKSASYVVDLNDEYRLIAIDSTTEGTGAHSVYEERLQWIAEQGEKAKADGKKLIGMHHQNLLEHMILSNLIQPNGVVTAKNKDAAEVYAKAGIKYVFTGHTHDHDIASYTAADGTVIYDAVTGSLGGYGTPYRVVTFGDDVKFETRRIEKVNVALFPAGISENALKLADSNFSEYQKTVTDLSYYTVFNNYTTASGLKSFLKLEDERMNEIIDLVGGKLNEALNMPFAKEDETEPGKSIESIIGEYDLTIPETDYKNVIEVAVTIYQAHNLGDESFPGYSDEIVLITRGLGAVLGYTLGEVSGEDYAKVLSFIASLAGVNVPVDFLKYAGDGITRAEGIEVLVTTVLLPLIVEFANDDAPGDCNVTLPGYAELIETEDEGILAKLMNFFKKIYEFVRTIFTFLPVWEK